MSKIFTYIRNNENNQKYTLEQRASVENYLFKNNITDFKYKTLYQTSKEFIFVSENGKKKFISIKGKNVF